MRVSRKAALSVLRKYLRRKREEHFEALQAHHAKKQERLKYIQTITIDNARSILRHDLSLGELHANKILRENERSKSEFPPCVLAFTNFRRDLKDYIIEQAVKVQADMNRRAREDALESFKVEFDNIKT